MTHQRPLWAEAKVAPNRSQPFDYCFSKGLNSGLQILVLSQMSFFITQQALLTPGTPYPPLLIHLLNLMDHYQVPGIPSNLLGPAQQCLCTSNIFIQVLIIKYIICLLQITGPAITYSDLEVATISHNHLSLEHRILPPVSLLLVTVCMLSKRSLTQS